VITVIGSINMDYTTVTENLPRKGETILSTYFNTAPGGKGANQAVAASKLGGKVQMIGALGKDMAGDTLYKRLEDEGLLLDGMRFVDIPTGNAMITVDSKGSNTIVVYSGANKCLDANYLKEKKDLIIKSKIMILQLETPVETVVYAAKMAKENNILCILNPAPARKLPEEIYGYLDYITPNETELFTLTGEEDPEVGAQKLLELGVKRVIVTMGEKGCLYKDDKESFFVDAFSVKPVDTTAAGDSFNGALAVALSEGKSIKEALIFANAEGALSTLSIGAQDALPSREKVDEFIKLNSK